MNIYTILNLFFYLKFFLLNNSLDIKLFLFFLKFFIWLLIWIKKNIKLKKNIKYNSYSNLFKKTSMPIFHTILSIKTISKTTKKGNYRKYKVISLIGNNSNWLGIGIKKNLNLFDCIETSYINAFYNINFYPITFFNYSFIFKNKGIIHTNNNIFSKNNYFFKLIFNLLRIKNINYKCIKPLNIEKILKNIKINLNEI